MIPGIVAGQAAAGSEEPSYTGPLDLVPGASFAWSQQALAAAFTDPAVRLILDDVGESEQDFAPTDNHSVSISAVNTFKGADNAFVKGCYDQTGNGYDVENFFATVETNPPGWAVIGASPHPAMGPRASAGIIVYPLGRDSAPNLSGGATIFLVMYKSADVLDNTLHPIQAYDSGFSANWQIGVGNEYLQLQVSEAVDWRATADATGLHILEWVVDAAGEVTILMDGVDMSATPDGVVTPLPATATGILEQEILANTALGPVTTAIYAAICWPGALSAPNRLAVRQNIAAYYGITL